jgi:hypothetical protein
MAETADYHHGDQEISQQRATYRLFGNLTKWTALVVGVSVVMAVLWFCVGASFLVGLIVGVIIFAAAAWFLFRTPTRNHDLVPNTRLHGS